MFGGDGTEEVVVVGGGKRDKKKKQTEWRGDARRIGGEMGKSSYNLLSHNQLA